MIASIERERQKRSSTSIEKIETNPKAEFWPLCLPAIQHALVASTLSSAAEPAGSDIDIQAELFLCNSFLNSIEELVRDLSLLPTAGTFFIAKDDGEKEAPLVVSDYVLLSLRDARLFTLAVGKLQRDYQRSMVTRLIDILHMGLHTANVKSRALEMISLRVDASRFIARAITLCASLVDIVAAPDLLPSLSLEVGSTFYNIPRMKQKPTPSCFRKEVCFQGLFADWQSPSVPASDISSTEILHESDFKKLQEVLQSALGVGFKASSQDGCHLLFSSWNAAAKLSSWTSLSFEGPATASTIKQCSFVQRMIRLRDEMCEVHYLLSGEDASLPHETLLMKVVSSKLSNCQPNEALLSGLSASEKMLANLALEVSKLRSLDSPPLPAFAYYEALPVYVSFLISMHTYRGNNDMGSIHRYQTFGLRSKKTSSYKDDDDDDDDVMEKLLSDDSADSDRYTDLEYNDTRANALRIKALARLHDACVKLGGAPCFPDWLDTGCRIREDMSPPIAVDSADRALLSLSNFGIAVFKCYCRGLKRALSALDLIAVPDQMLMSSSLALQLIFAQQHYLPLDITESFYLQVSSLCHINISVLKLVTNTLANQNNLASNFFCTHSAQRIKGAAVAEGWRATPGEYRANGQWETLVSETLLGSSLLISSAAITDAVGDDADLVEEITSALMAVKRWRRVLYSIINAMVPAAALLRFGVKDGKGRQLHPLCEDIPGTRSSHSSENNEVNTSRSSTKNDVGITIKKVLSFLSCISAYSMNDEDMRLTCLMAAGHLMESSAQFRDLESLWNIRICCEAIGGVINTLAIEKMSELQLSSASSIIEIMLKQLSTRLDSPAAEGGQAKNSSVAFNPVINESDLLEKEQVNRFLACFGLRSLLSGRLIGNVADIELIDMLARGENIDPLVEREDSRWFRPWGSIQSDVSKLLLTLLCGNVQLQRRVRTFVARMLNDLIVAENKVIKSTSPGVGAVVRFAVANAFDSLEARHIQRLVEDICSLDDDGFNEKKDLSNKLAVLVSYLASVSHKEIPGTGCKSILSEMSRCLDQWAACTPVQNRVMSLMCLLSSRFGALPDVGRAIFSLVLPEKETGNVTPGYVSAMKDFLEFVVLLDKLLNQKSSSASLPPIPPASNPRVTEKTKQKADSKCSYVTLGNGNDVLRSCSYAETGEAFTEQHWYNCYTCGLLWDKVGILHVNDASCELLITKKNTSLTKSHNTRICVSNMFRVVAHYVPEFAMRAMMLDILGKALFSVIAVPKHQLRTSRAVCHASVCLPYRRTLFERCMMISQKQMI